MSPRHFLRFACLLVAAAAIYLAAANAQSTLSPGRLTPDVGRDCQGKDPERGIASCTRILALGAALAQQDRAMAHYNRGNAWLVKRELDRAIADFDAALKLNPLLSNAYYNRGNAWYYKGDTDRAISDYDATLRLDPNYSSAYQNRGSVWLNKGNLDRGLADFDAALRLNPENAHAYMNRGVIRLIKRDFNRAGEDFAAALRLDPGSAEIHRLRGLALSSKGERDLAATEFEAAIRIAPDDKSYNGRASLLEKKGELDRALVDVAKALELNPKSFGALATRAEIRRDRGDLDRALADIELAISLHGPPVNALDARTNYAEFLAIDAGILQRLGRREAALEAYDKAIALDPDNTEAREQRASLGAPATSGPAVLVAAATPPVAAATPPVAAATSPPGPPSGPATASQAKANPGARIALVIGNSSYVAVERLPNPKADAAAVGQAFRRAGFATVVVDDVSRAGLIQALNDFSDRAVEADWAVVYYAGHGIEIGGVNYLVPVDARLKADRDVADEAVPLDRVIGAIERARTLRLVVLDACRNNPFAAQMQRTVASRAVGRGLAPIEPEGGTLVAFSAKHGQVALDGTGTNSPFATALVKRLETPGLEIGKLFRLVRDDVLTTTDRQQEPFVYGSLPADDLFVIPPAR